MHMKIKKSLVALTTATAVAISGSAVAAAEDTQNPDTGATQQDGSLQDATGSLKNEDGLSGSLDDMFGWKNEGDTNAEGEEVDPTTGLQKLKDIAALFTLIVGIIGTAATLMTTIEKFQK